MNTTYYTLKIFKARRLLYHKDFTHFPDFLRVANNINEELNITPIPTPNYVSLSSKTVCGNENVLSMYKYQGTFDLNDYL